MLIEYKPKLFACASDTEVKYYSYGSDQPASCTIIAEEKKKKVQKWYDIDLKLIVIGKLIFGLSDWYDIIWVNKWIDYI